MNKIEVQSRQYDEVNENNSLMHHSYHCWSRVLAC